MLMLHGTFKAICFQQCPFTVCGTKYIASVNMVLSGYHTFLSTRVQVGDTSHRKVGSHAVRVQYYLIAVVGVFELSLWSRSMLR